VKKRFVSLAIAALAVVAGASLAATLAHEPMRGDSIERNDLWTTGLADSESLEPDDVLLALLNSFHGSATIFPTENHLYFRMTAKGTQIGGNICLPAATRDQGEFYLSYTEVLNLRSEAIEPRGWEREYRKGATASLVKLRKNLYRISIKGISADIKINEVDWRPKDVPVNTLTEVPVAPFNDESSTRFVFVFDKASKVFWYQTDWTLLGADERLLYRPSGIVIQPRTGFIYYKDSIRGRLILIAVNDRSVRQNDWFDGPCDQTPENLELDGAIDFFRYIYEVNPDLRGKIDKFGVYLDDPETRLAVAAFDRYADVDAYVDSIEAKIKAGGSDWYKSFLLKFTRASLGVPDATK
jgi:hypothetical protein